MWIHWVVRAVSPKQPFQDFDTAKWTWASLMTTFPEVLSAVLMPNHCHLILPKTLSNQQVSTKLGGVLGGISRRNKDTNLWERIPPPSPIPDLFHLKRQIRYVALNPCRKSLCRDPLEWYWSTYRDIVGASVNKKLSAQKLAAILGDQKRNFEVRFHAYVSGDPSVQVAGTPFPKSATPKILAQHSINEILSACAGALRLAPHNIKDEHKLRALFIHMAYRHGWDHANLLSQICGVTRGAVYLSLKRGAPDGIQAAELCLGDKRLSLPPIAPIKTIQNVYKTLHGGASMP